MSSAEDRGFSGDYQLRLLIGGKDARLAPGIHVPLELESVVEQVLQLMDKFCPPRPYNNPLEAQRQLDWKAAFDALIQKVGPGTLANGLQLCDRARNEEGHGSCLYVNVYTRRNKPPIFSLCLKSDDPKDEYLEWTWNLGRGKDARPAPGVHVPVELEPVVEQVLQLIDEFCPLLPRNNPLEEQRELAWEAACEALIEKFGRDTLANGLRLCHCARNEEGNGSCLYVYVYPRPNKPPRFNLCLESDDPRDEYLACYDFDDTGIS